MFERVRASLRAHGDRKIVPLSLADLPAIAPRDWAFYNTELTEAITANPHLAWRVEGTSEYVIGGHWRRRHEIGSVEELHARTSRSQLLAHLVQRLRDEGASLVVLGPTEQERNLSFYLTEDFRVVDEIVRYQRLGTDAGCAQPTVAIRPLLPDDRPALLAVDHAAFPWLWWNSEAEFDWYLGLPGVEAHVVTIAEQLVGYASFTIAGRQGHLDRLAVAPAEQGAGIGRALVCHTLARMALRRVERVALTTQVDNRRSAGLYRMLGFTRTALHYPIYGKWLSDPSQDSPRC